MRYCCTLSKGKVTDPFSQGGSRQTSVAMGSREGVTPCHSTNKKKPLLVLASRVRPTFA